MAEQQNVEKPMTPMTLEQKKARWAELESKQRRGNLFMRSWNPDIYVRWVRRFDPNDISYHEGMGFKIAVNGPQSGTPNKQRFNYTTPPNAEGHFVHGDVILMEGPRVDYEYYCNLGVELSRQRLEGPKDRFLAEAKKSGFKGLRSKQEDSESYADVR